MTITFRNRHRLKRKQIKNFLTDLQLKFSIPLFDEKSAVDTAQYDNQKIIIVDDDVDFFYYKEVIFFTLKGIYKYRPRNYYVIVDMGAVGFVTDGADVMAPGIVDADPKIEPGNLIWIADETHRKPLGVGEALLTGEEMIRQNKGKAIKNIHYIGDRLWQLSNG
jgi:PUA domain protein